MNWLRIKLRKWLGIERNLELIRYNEQAISNLVQIGVDVNFKEPTTIIIFSKINGGYVRQLHIPINNMMDLKNLVQDLEAKYSTNITTWDTPLNFRL